MPHFVGPMFFVHCDSLSFQDHCTSRVTQRIQAKMTTQDERTKEGRTHIHEFSCAWARPNAPSSQDAERTRMGARTQTQMPVRLYEERCMGTPKRSLVIRQTNVQGRGRENNHECSYVFTKRRRAWACPKRSLVTRWLNIQGRRRE